jgi:hypothetical protein
MDSRAKLADALVCLLFGATSLAGAIWFYIWALNLWLPW